MIDFTNLKDEQLVVLADQILDVSKKKSAKDLYQLLGNALRESGFSVDAEGNATPMPDKFFERSPGQKMDIQESFQRLSELASKNGAEIETDGKNFWERFKEELRNTLCKDEKIKNLFNTDGALKELIKISIPVILTALGWAAMGPFGLAILAGVLALIAKVGFKVYCEGVS